MACRTKRTGKIIFVCISFQEQITPRNPLRGKGFRGKLRRTNTWQIKLSKKLRVRKTI